MIIKQSKANLQRLCVYVLVFSGNKIILDDGLSQGMRDKKAEMKITCIFFALHPENIHLIRL